MGADGNAADHNYGNCKRASQLQYGECGNRFIQLYTKCIFYDNTDHTATDSEAPFVVETTEEDKQPKVNGSYIYQYSSSAGIKKIEVYGYVTPTTNEGASGEYWATYYNATQGFTADANTKVFQAALNGSQLTMTEVANREIPAGKAVILKSTSSTITLTPSRTRAMLMC